MALSTVGSQGYSYDATNSLATSTSAENNIETSYVAAFREGFEQAFQQTESKLQPYFESESQSEEYQYFDRVGIASVMSEDVSRYGDNPFGEIEHDRRRIGLKDYELGKYIDEKDLKRVITDPMNAYTQALLASGKRKIDDIIIDSFFGSAYTGKNGGVTKTFVGASDTATIIEVGADTVGAGQSTSGGNLITGSETLYTVDSTSNTEGFSIGSGYDGSASGTASDTGLSLAKLRGARSTMLKLNAINQDEVVNCFVTSKQIDDLLGITEVVSSDFAVRKALVEGTVVTFMGFRFIVCERLPISAGSERRCIVATPKALKMSIGTALKGDMWRVPAKKNIPYLYFKMAADASRMWGEVSGEIRCVE
tara:strand:- start:11666 stop:12763 length:1098 start_codon:yes stop_codon:yes gene_type:complete